MVIPMKICLTASLVFALVAAMVWAIPLCDYRSPHTDIINLGVSFSYRYYNDPYGFTDYDVDRGKLEIDYTRLFDSPEFGFDITGQGDITISVLSLSSFAVSMEGDLKRYLDPETLLFGFAGVSADSLSSYDNIGLEVRAGLGYGRFVDVTPLAKAMKIGEYLLQRGSIFKELDGLDLQAIAYELDSAEAYESMADLLDVLQEIIEGTGFIREGVLDALDVYEIARIVEDETYVRYCGGDIKLGIGYELLDPMDEATDLLGTVSFNYAFTTTPEAQFLVQGHASTLAGSFDILQNNELAITLGYDYLLADRLSVFSSYSYSSETRKGSKRVFQILATELVLTPLEDAKVALGIRFEHKPEYLEWAADIDLSIAVDLL